MIQLMVFNNAEVKKIQKKRVSLKPERKSIKIDLIVDWENFTLSLVTFFKVIR